MRGKYLLIFADEKNFVEFLRKFLPGARQAICAAKHFGLLQYCFRAGGILFNLPFAAGGENSPVGFSADTVNRESGVSFDEERTCGRVRPCGEAYTRSGFEDVRFIKK